MRLPVLIEKNHTEEQTTLDSPGVATGYPREFEYQGLTVKAKWISIIEDMIVPEFFMRRINYKAIHKRMEKKFKRLKDLIPHEET